MYCIISAEDPQYKKDCSAYLCNCRIYLQESLQTKREELLKAPLGLNLISFWFSRLTVRKDGQTVYFSTASIFFAASTCSSTEYTVVQAAS